MSLLYMLVEFAFVVFILFLLGLTLICLAPWILLFWAIYMISYRWL
jgi:hypothetical protein